MLGSQFFIPEAPDALVPGWLRDRIHGISLCLNSALPENALVLIYSGIDTLGFLDAQATQRRATKDTFEAWSSLYILPALKPVEGASPTPVDLYGARCGILHTSSSSSKLGSLGVAREIWYQFRGKCALNRTLNTSGLPLLIDVDQFASTFQDGSGQFLTELKADNVRFARAEERSDQFFAWGVRSAPFSDLAEHIR